MDLIAWSALVHPEEGYVCADYDMLELEAHIDVRKQTPTEAEIHVGLRERIQTLERKLKAAELVEMPPPSLEAYAALDAEVARINARLMALRLGNQTAAATTTVNK